MALVVAKDRRIAAGSWGESKQRVNVMLTQTAIERIDAIAEQMDLTRSEVLERLARSTCLTAEQLAQITGSEDSGSNT